ncbi:transmembrane protein 258-like [Phacochoerus africanus]|uniref:transmembrane protein 258-like n=1 Tax=Phacochoerus africanus TaxID=41426 RepID=UPI001FD9558F|nr:transmembrane protein 258-like [Phacochoerus africanus]
MWLKAMSIYIHTIPEKLAIFPHLTILLLAIGWCFTAWLFVYEVTSTKHTRDKKLLVSMLVSLFIGFGFLFLLLWVGIYI